MKIINIKNYKVEGFDDKGKKVEVPFEVKESIINIVLARHNQWDGLELLKASQVAEKVKDSKNEVVLEDAEYETVKTAVTNFKGYSRNDVEMVKRVLEAKDYKIKKK